MNELPGTFERPLSEYVINGLPIGKVIGKQSPLDSCSQDIEDGVEDDSAVRAGSSPFARLGKNRFDSFPLGRGEIGWVGDFHRLDWSALNLGAFRKSKRQFIYS